MALLQMSFENYRCFKERQVVELRPITIILGKNNSGKSAVTRLPLLLQTGIRTDSTFPLDLDSLGEDPPDYLDLVYERNVHRKLSLGFITNWVDRTIELNATIQNASEQHLQFISELEVISDSQRDKLEWIPDQVGQSYLLSRSGDEPTRVDVQFSGLMPRMTYEDGLTVELFFSPYEMGLYLPTPHYLGPYRQRPSRLTRLPSRIATDVGSAGEYATGMLVNDHVRGGGVLIAQVNRLLGNNLAGWKLEVEAQGPLYAVVLRSETNPNLVVNLLDSGTGVAQVLPLLVQRAQAMISSSSFANDQLQVIEEPELHLHPAFHALLADLLIAGKQQGGRFLIETHSETLLLRLRRRIAEGEISATDVAVYFVEHEAGSSRVVPVEIDEMGNLSYWPPGVFSEDYEETKELAKAQFSRVRDEG